MKTNHKSKIQKIFFYISDLHFYFHFKEKVHEFECLENDVDRRVIGKKVNSSVSLKMYPPASKASREIANLTERKKSIYPRIWCQRIFNGLMVYFGPHNVIL